MFDISANSWTWLSGSSSTGQSAIYGTQGIEASGNSPGGMFYPTMVFDSTESCLYVFGGFGRGSLKQGTTTAPIGITSDSLWFKLLSLFLRISEFFVEI